MLRLFYKSKGVALYKSARPDSHIYLLIDQIREKIRVGNKYAFESILFVLHNNGKFDVQFEYPDGPKLKISKDVEISWGKLFKNFIKINKDGLQISRKNPVNWNLIKEWGISQTYGTIIFVLKENQNLNLNGIDRVLLGSSIIFDQQSGVLIIDLFPYILKGKGSYDYYSLLNLIADFGFSGMLPKYYFDSNIKAPASKLEDTKIQYVNAMIDKNTWLKVSYRSEPFVIYDKQRNTLVLHSYCPKCGIGGVISSSTNWAVVNDISTKPIDWHCNRCDGNWLIPGFVYEEEYITNA